ncbi:unnamed protein product (macronuclear) [Paramecium tetraurelia]|uniref:Cache domain-containing protein n=1 Tax=Paramecium tetraurelia TaxID=5888 RepID=A0BEM2_PARTE|nr:uncharacterized protein GSPATT00028022001 [Paramecium tetraurelia]CAK56989.1 unnamed protein product [Paramecium tetraurelia]|eukprot:XP_001424387.1 hypothetical protein (macronuclear) [Paramecium tetraurelia strain d4-2]
MNKQSIDHFFNRCLRANLGRFKMRTQILIINGIILTLLIPSILIAYAINMYSIEQILYHSLQGSTILEMSKHLDTASILLNHQLNSAFIRTQISLTNLNQLYWLQQQNEIIATSQISRMCDYFQPTLPPEHNYSILCFSTFGQESSPQTSQQNTNVSQQLQSVTNLVGSLILSSMRLNDGYLPNQIYFISSVNSNQYGFLYPQLTIYPNYNPKERQWYKSHFENLQKDKNNNTQITNIYKYFDAQPIYSITMTQSMLNLKKEVEGLFCADLVFTNNLIPQLNINIMIVNTEGTLILSNYKNDIVSNSSLLISFYDEEITGFTTDDWNSILNYYYTKQINSTCNYEQFQILCRFNSIYNKDVVIQIIKLQNIDYFLILFYDIQIEEEIQFNINHLLHIIHQNLNQLILVTILASVGIISLQVIIIYIIFLPMYKVISQSLYFLKKQQKSNQQQPQNLLQKINEFQNIIINKIRPNQNQQESNNALMQFKFKFNTLFDRVLEQRMTINPQCQIIQQFKYPRKGVYNCLDILNIIKEGQIQDNYYEQQSANPKSYSSRRFFNFNVEQ